MSNFSTQNNVWTSNNLVALSNFSTSNNVWTSNSLVAFSNLSTTNNAWTSNNLISLSNFSTSNFYNSNLNIYNSNVNNSNSVRGIWASNSVVFGCNCAVYSSNSLNSLATTATVTVLSNTFSNYRAKSAFVPWTEVSGKPNFSSDGAGNDSLGAAGVTIGSAGLLMSGYALLDRNGKLTDALSDAFGKMTIDPTRYFKLNDPGSYIDIGDSTTRVSIDRLLFKTGTFSNMILNPGSLSYSNAILTLCNQIALTATSISNFTDVSCSTNLTATGIISTTSNIGIGTSTPRYGLKISKPLPNIGLVWGASNKGRIDFLYNSDPIINLGACARIEATDDVNHGGHLDFQNRTVGSANSNMNSRLFIKSSGLVGINNNNPQYQLDVNGTANVSATLTSATHSNSGNLQTSYAQTATLSNSGNLSVGNIPTASVYSGMQRKVWNSQKQNTWGSGGSNFYLLGTFPAAGSGGNASSINITGTVGNWVYNQTAKIDLSIATIWNRHQWHWVWLFDHCSSWHGHHSIQFINYQFPGLLGNLWTIYRLRLGGVVSSVRFLDSAL
jgi:hypothetical protein